MQGFSTLIFNIVELRNDLGKLTSSIKFRSQDFILNPANRSFFSDIKIRDRLLKSCYLIYLIGLNNFSNSSKLYHINDLTKNNIINEIKNCNRN